MTILSLKKGDYTINNYGADSLTFETSKTIFPRSGIVIHWDTDTDTKTDTDTE